MQMQESINNYIHDTSELVIETPRLCVRPLQTGDHDMWRQAWMSLGSARSIWDHGQKLKEECGEDVFLPLVHRVWEDIRMDVAYTLTVFEKSSGAVIGSVALMDLSRAIFQNAYFGYHIMHHHWRKGYAFEACQYVMAFAFDRLALHRIEAGIEPENEPSCVLAKKLGMRVECVSPRRLFIRGAWRDMSLYAMTVEDWDALEQAPVLWG